MDDVLVDESLFTDVDSPAPEQMLGSGGYAVDADGEERQTSVEAECLDTDPQDSLTTTASRYRREAPASSHKKGKVYKKKSTYVVRKEKKRELLKEVEALQARLHDLEAPHVSAKQALAASKRDNMRLRETAVANKLSLATSQSAVTRLLNGDQSNPLSNTWIRLNSNWNDRRATLLETKSNAINHACKYVEARSRFLDPLKRHVSEERFETAKGDFCCVRYDVRQFTDVKNVKQVYDAMVSFFLNIEISVSERLGDITTRDDFDFVENSIVNFRFLSTEFGVPIEKQGVLFMEYFENHELSNGEPCGVIVTDIVEDDELYPYTTQERLRKDSSVNIVLTPHWREDPQGGKELVVSMAMGKFIKLHHSECPFAAPEAVDQMRENVMGWASVMNTTLHDILKRSPP